MRDRLPEGFVDAVRLVALNTTDGDVLVVRLGGESFSLYEPSHPLVKAWQQVEALWRGGVKCDVLLLLGRTDRQTGERKPLTWQVREFA